MVNLLIMAVMLSLAALYSGGQSTLSGAAAHSRGGAQAAAMANYRALALDYYSAHPEQTTFTPPATASPLAAAGDWGNYHPAGSLTVAVYAKTAPAPDLLQAVLAQSQNSWLVGTAEGGYFKPALSAVASELPLPAIAAGHPVWIGSINPSH